MALVSEVLSRVPGAGVADGSTDEANHGRVPPARPQHCSGHYSMCASLDTAYLQRLTGTLSIIFIEMVDDGVVAADDDDVDLLLSDAYSI